MNFKESFDFYCIVRSQTNFHAERLVVAFFFNELRIRKFTEYGKRREIIPTTWRHRWKSRSRGSYIFVPTSYDFAHYRILNKIVCNRQQGVFHFHWFSDCSIVNSLFDTFWPERRHNVNGNPRSRHKKQQNKAISGHVCWCYETPSEHAMLSIKVLTWQISKQKTWSDRGAKNFTTVWNYNWTNTEGSEIRISCIIALHWISPQKSIKKFLSSYEMALGRPLRSQSLPVLLNSENSCSRRVCWASLYCSPSRLFFQACLVYRAAHGRCCCWHIGSLRSLKRSLAKHLMFTASSPKREHKPAFG